MQPKRNQFFSPHRNENVDNAETKFRGSFKRFHTSHSIHIPPLPPGEVDAFRAAGEGGQPTTRYRRPHPLARRLCVILSGRCWSRRISTDAPVSGVSHVSLLCKREARVTRCGRALARARAFAALRMTQKKRETKRRSIA